MADMSNFERAMRREDRIAFVTGTVIVIFLVCVFTGLAVSETKQETEKSKLYTACLNAGKDWHDGDCVTPK